MEDCFSSAVTREVAFVCELHHRVTKGRTQGHDQAGLVVPEIAESLGSKFAISNRMLDVLVAEIVLQRPSIHTLIGQLEPS
jgi:UTP:GlnB (protein PII) uridylyltransferase